MLNKFVLIPCQHVNKIKFRCRNASNGNWKPVAEKYIRKVFPWLQTCINIRISLLIHLWNRYCELWNNFKGYYITFILHTTSPYHTTIQHHFPHHNILHMTPLHYSTPHHDTWHPYYKWNHFTTSHHTTSQTTPHHYRLQMCLYMFVYVFIGFLSLSSPFDITNANRRCNKLEKIKMKLAYK